MRDALTRLGQWLASGVRRMVKGCLYTRQSKWRFV
jgi:hypothetical protein